MGRIFIFIAAFFCISHANAQVITDDTVTLKRGIYRTFEEFRRNKPSLQTPFSAILKERGYGTLNGSKHNAWSLAPEKPEEIGEKTEVWGFCDGQYVYIHSGRYYHPHNVYDKITFMGRYCLFETVETWYLKGGVIIPVPLGLVGGAVTGALAYAVKETNRTFSHCIFNINNGSVQLLTKPLVDEILKKDPELHAEYKMEKDKKSKLREYVIRYSENNSDEIKR